MKKVNYIVHKNVIIGKNVEIGDFVIIGIPPKGKKEGEIKTIIGDGAILRSHSIIYAGNSIGKNFQTGHNVMLRENNLIGDDVSIGTSSVIEYQCRIGDKVRIHSQAFICEYSILEEGCWIGPNVVFTNALHPLCPAVKKCLKGPHIKKNVKIGANATILAHIIVEENSLIGAGSVVINNISPNSVAFGNPAKIYKEILELKCHFGRIKRPY